MKPNRQVTGRLKPARGVHVHLGQPTIVHVVVCSEKRIPWIAQSAVQNLLLQVWSEAQTWLVGYYLLMPDHMHFFAAPRDLNIPFNRWMKYWKTLFTQRADNPEWLWQSLHWDTRLRRSESYTEKWYYIRDNPVKEGLVTTADNWPYQGMMNVLPW